MATSQLWIILEILQKKIDNMQFWVLKMIQRLDFLSLILKQEVEVFVDEYYCPVLSVPGKPFPEGKHLQKCLYAKYLNGCQK